MQQKSKTSGLIGTKTSLATKTNCYPAFQKEAGFFFLRIWQTRAGGNLLVL